MNASCHRWMSHMSRMNWSRHTDEWVVSHIWMSHVTDVRESCHMNESCHTWMRHVTYEWVTSHMHESCHIWVSHVVMDESCHIWVSHVTYGWVMSHMNESCQIWMSHVPYAWVMSYMDESCQIWMSHVPYECDMIFSFIYVTWFFNVWHNLFICHVTSEYGTYITDTAISRRFRLYYRRLWKVFSLLSNAAKMGRLQSFILASRSVYRCCSSVLQWCVVVVCCNSELQ